MHVLDSANVRTEEFPLALPLLKEHLPNVLMSQCFNDDNLPFAIEVKNTEIGHLYEHILLEYLCQNKMAKGHKKAVFTGKTKWNWIRDPFGVFHIRLNCGAKDADILMPAVEQTNALMQIILNYGKTVVKDEQETDLILPREFMHQKSNFTLSTGLKNGKIHQE